MKYRLTRDEIRCIARNVSKIINPNTNMATHELSKLRIQAILGRAGVPLDAQPQAAIEAEYRWCFSQETEAQVAMAMRGKAMLRVVNNDRLEREPFPSYILAKW